MRSLKKLLSLLLCTGMLCSLAACVADGTEGAKDEAPVAEAPAPEDGDAGEEVAAPAVADDDDTVVINFSMMAFANEVDAWTAMIDQANEQLAEKNIRIQINKVPGTGWPEYYQKVATQMAGGQSPDIGRIAESFMPTLIEKNQVVDLTDYLANDFDMELYYEKTFENAAYRDGRYYGIPSGLYYYLMYYNKDLFDEAGLSYPSADWDNAISFDEVREAAATITTGSGGEKVYGFSCGPYLAALGMYSTSLGGNNVFDANGEPSLNDANTKEVLQWFDEMLRTDYSMPRPTDTKVMDAFEMFRSGRVGMIIDGTWWLGGVAEIENFEVGIAAVPAGAGTAYTSQFVDSFIIFSGTEHEAESWEAIKAITSTEGFEVLSTTGVGGIPVVKSVADSVIDASLGNNIDEASKQAAMDGMNHTLGVPYNSYYEEADQRINNMMDDWLLGNITSDEYADKIQQIMVDFANRE